MQHREPTYRIKFYHSGAAGLFRSIRVKRGWFWRDDWEFVSGHGSLSEAKEAMHKLISAKAVLEVHDYRHNGKSFHWPW